MRNDESVLRPAAAPAGRRSSSTPSGCCGREGWGRRFVAFALHAPPWTYVVLTFVGLTAALLLAALRA